MDWLDHDEVMEAVVSGRYDADDIESMIEYGLADVDFDEDDVEEICSVINREDLKNRLRYR